jgi:hypothetical protein
MGRFKTLSKGLKNFVLDDATSLDEALASARSDESRESTAQQLDAFHKTFNFCMSCRQYTCANCWNEAEGECQSCSPVAGGLSAAWARGDGSAPAWPAAAAEPAGIEAVAWPSTDRRPPAPEPAPDEVPWPLAALEGRTPVVEPEADIEPEPVFAAEAEPEPEPVAEEEPVFAAEPEPITPAATPTGVEERAAAAATNTSNLLARFRPGQSIDDALAAYEALVEAEPAAQPEPEPEPAAAEPEAEPAVRAEPEPVPWPEAEPVVWPEAEPVAWPKAEPVAWPEAEPEPVAAAEPEPEPEPVAWPEAEPEPEPVVWAEPELPVADPAQPWARPARPAEDIVEVPTWHVVAPEGPNGHPAETLKPAARTDRPVPEWPSQPAESFLAARLAARKAGDDMWAASSVEVLGPAAGTGAAVPAGVQACVSCGLSLSATARFCRRCGTRQG